MLAEDGRELDEAESLIRRALAEDPENGGFLDSLGWVYFQKKQYKKALETLESALSFEKDEGVIWEHVGDAYLALGDPQKAIENYSQGLQRKNEERDQIRIQKKYDDLSKRVSSKG